MLGGDAELRNLDRRADLMVMATTPIYYTAEMVRALPDDGQRYETVYGELLVTPSPRELHQRVLQRLQLAVGNYLDRYPVAATYSSPADISWGPDILVQPDLFVVDLEQARTGNWARMQLLLLAIEILSPSTTRYDRFTKRRLYQEVGIPSYWMVDPERRLVEIWTPGATAPFVETEGLYWHPHGAPMPLEIDVQRLFRPL